ncbi:MAG: type IV pilin protein [Bacilli bacterium]
MDSKNKVKAFTIVELLGVIVILGILAALAIPVVTQYLEDGKVKYDVSLKKELLLAGKNYYANNKLELPLVSGGMNYVTAKEMASQNLLSSDVVNSKGEDCSDSYVVVKKGDKDYEYTSCMYCGGKYYNPETNDIKSELECTISEEIANNEYLIYYLDNEDNITDREIGNYGTEKTLKTLPDEDDYVFNGWIADNYKCDVYNDKGIKQECTLNINGSGGLTSAKPNPYIILRPQWIERPKCKVTTDPETVGGNSWTTTNSVKVTFSCEDESDCIESEKTISIPTGSTINEEVSGTISRKNGVAPKTCSTTVKVDNQGPTVNISRKSCTESISINEVKDDGSGIASYVWTNSSTPPTINWINYSGFISQPSAALLKNAKVYLHVKDNAGNITTKYVATHASTSCGSCGTITDDVDVFWWGGIYKNQCDTSKNIAFNYYQYKCTCSLDKISKEWCSTTNIEQKHKNFSYAVVYYRTKDICNSRNSSNYNAGVVKVCDSDEDNRINSSAGDMFKYHGYRFYYNTTPSEGFVNFNAKVGNWYSWKKDTYTNGSSAYKEACKYYCNYDYANK